MKLATTVIIASLLGVVILTGTGQAQTDDIDPWQDLICFETRDSSSCSGAGSSACRDDVHQQQNGGVGNMIQCNSGAPKCRWWNSWEVDVRIETDSDEQVRGLRNLPEPHPTSPEEYSVTGRVQCVKTGEEPDEEGGESCKATDVNRVCGSDLESGGGEANCTQSLSVGIPSGVTYTVTCKDPAHPYIAFRAVDAGEPFIWQRQIMHLNEDGHELAGPFQY